MSERNTFSPFWHRVRTMRPRLRPHVQITRQHYRGRRWYVVHDPAANGFYRLDPVSHEFVGLLDGTRTVEAVWQLNLARHGDEALTQNDVIQVLSQLFGANLLTADVPPETEQMLTRGRERFQRKAMSQAIGLMYFRVRLFNPGPVLHWLLPIFRPVLNRGGLALWVIAVVAGIAALVPRWDELRAGFSDAIAPSNWAWMLVVYVGLKLWHELGHGLICRRFGGQVPEFGAMMLVLVPSPYVDASSAWSFTDKWKRIAVGAGGMMFELFAASLGAFVWLSTRDDPGLLHQLAFNVMLTSGVSTILFNANPLMRFDGYYMLSDLLEVPNLMQRSMQLLKFLAQKHLFGIEGAQAPTTVISEAGILLVFGVLAMGYRVLIFISITLYLVGQLFALGVFLALWTAAMWFILPVGGMINWLATAPALGDRRPRAVLTTLGLFVLLAVLVGAVPMPDRRRAQGVVESGSRAGLFAPSDAVVARAFKRAGDSVKAGEVIAELDSPELVASLELARAQLLEGRSQETQATATNAATAQIAREYVKAFEAQVAVMEEQVSRLVVRAPHDGVVVTADPGERLGQRLTEGELLCEVIDPADLRIAVALPQAEADWISALPRDRYRVEFRRAANVEVIQLATALRLPSSGRRDLPHAALAYEGGGTIETEQGRPGQDAVAKRAYFNAYFAPAEGSAEVATVGYPGERVYLRFSLPRRPWLAQWIDRLDKTLQGRARI